MIYFYIDIRSMHSGKMSNMKIRTAYSMYSFEVSLEDEFSMIKLIDLIHLTGLSLGKYKIHCATGFNPTPLEAFYGGEFKKWQEYQRNKNFRCDNILSLIHLGGTDWLFAGIYKVLGAKAKSTGDNSWFEYKTLEIQGLDHLSGRTIVTFNKKFRASYLKGENHIDSLIVKEIKPERLSIGDFPGYNEILIPFRILMMIVHQNIESWRTALSNVNGVYIITDTTNGKHYIGSAYGGGGIWNRWSSYAATGHGGNKELVELLNGEGKGIEHAMNFLFTILELIDLNASKDHVICRESHWKDALMSRAYGYNKN